MPKHISDDGLGVKYHPIVIRFTTRQWKGLEAMAARSGKKVNEIVRMITDRQLEVFGLLENTN